MSSQREETEMEFDEAPIAIRMLTTDDDPALSRLAELDSADIPGGHLLGASVDGRLVAAQSLATGESIADPFLATGQIRMLLAQRAGQLNGRGRGRLLGRLRRRRAHGALPSSPPGAGGKLLQI
jgi:hypothetical protein